VGGSVSHRTHGKQRHVCATRGSYPWVLALRQQLIAEGALIEREGFLVFTKDVEFSSPSAAAAVIHGGTANGLLAWKTKDGKTLKQLDEEA
jgi:hypothetical protein